MTLTWMDGAPNHEMSYFLLLNEFKLRQCFVQGWVLHIVRIE